jgi:UDP-glucose 4-epimerase
VTITTAEMTRFLLSLEEAVDTILVALESGKPGETYIPRAPSARVADIAAVLIGEREIEIATTGIRPGEKVHEILVSEEEANRTFSRGDYYVIAPLLPELQETAFVPELEREYSSANETLNRSELEQLLQAHSLLLSDARLPEEDLIA